jgi:hypothetical protein
VVLVNAVVAAANSLKMKDISLQNVELKQITCRMNLKRHVSLQNRYETVVISL